MSQNPYASGAPNSDPWGETPKESSLSILAVLSLVFSILCLSAPLGVLLGVVSLFTIAGSGGRKHGKGLAISGIVVGLLFSTCLTFVGIGTVMAGKELNNQFYKPVGGVLTAIDAKDNAKARLSMGTALAAGATDEAIDAFRTAYQADHGTYVSGPASMMEFISGVAAAGQRMQAAQQQIQARGYTPLPAKFANGWTIIAVPQQPSMNGQIESIGIVSKSGTILWLVDPALLAPGGASAPKPPKAVKPESPAKPDAPAKPEN